MNSENFKNIPFNLQKYLQKFNLLEILNLSYMLLLFLLSVILILLKKNVTPLLGIPVYMSLTFIILVVNYLKYKNIIRSKYYNIIYLAFILIIFDSMYNIVPYLFPHADALLSRIDEILLFNFIPSKYFADNLSQNPVFNLILMVSYIIYFFLPLVILSVHFFSGKKAVIIYDIFYITLGLYLCYLGYILIPALGPRFYYHFSDPLAGNDTFLSLMDLINSLEKNKFDVFPSAHVQMGTIALFLVRKNKILFPLFLLEYTGILLSTILLRFHYVIDIIAGILFFYLTLFIAGKLKTWYQYAFQQDPFIY